MLTTRSSTKTRKLPRDLEDSSSSFSSSQMYVITKDFDQQNLDPNHMRKNERKKERMKESSSPFEDGGCFFVLALWRDSCSLASAANPLCLSAVQRRREREREKRERV